jgi:predicted transposase/invertase (TIGR01784 family)
LLGIEVNRSSSLTIVSPYAVPKLHGMKDTYVDVKARLNDGSQVIIEMQVLNHAGFEKRVLYNAAKHYASQLVTGNDYPLLTPVVALSIVDFNLFEPSPTDLKPVPYLSRIKLLDTQTLTEYSGDIELVFIELPKFTANPDQHPLQTPLAQWVYFIKHAEQLQQIPAELQQSTEFNQAFHLVNEANLSAEELDEQYKRKEFLYIQRSSIEKASNDGLARGIEQVAKALKNQGVADAVIVAATGLSLGQIAAL